MGSKRRYKPITAEHRVYHQSFDRYRIASRILNSGNKMPSVHSILFDKQNLQGLLLELNGNEKGIYFFIELNEWRKASIPTIREMLKDVDQKFKDFQQQKVNEGFSKPTEMPIELFEKKLKLEAKLDVLREEVEEIEKRLKEFSKIEQKEDDQMVLRYGALGNGKMRGGVLAEISGQTVKKNKDDVLMIDDSRSPYDGMLVADYRKQVSEPWALARRKIEKAKINLKKKLYDQGRLESFDEEWEKTHHEYFAENPDWKNLFAISLAGKPKIPAWPDGVKNYKNKRRQSNEKKYK